MEIEEQRSDFMQMMNNDKKEQAQQEILMTQKSRREEIQSLSNHFDKLMDSRKNFAEQRSKFQNFRKYVDYGQLKSVLKRSEEIL